MAHQPTKTTNPHQPRGAQHDIGEAEKNDFERSQEELPISDPGDAQRSSKTEPDGDGEEEMR